MAVLAERFFGFELGRRQWTGIGLVALIVFDGIAVGVGLILVLSHLIERIPVQRGVLLGIAAGLGFGISDVAIKALSGDLDSGPVGLLSPWSVVIVTAAVFSFYASARSLQIGDGVAVIAVTSVAANLSTILAGLAVFGDRLGDDARRDRRAPRGVRHDPRRGGADPSARSRRRGARRVSRGT
jgi:drug/metabolite transporter (DMT)-like permease